MTLKRRKKRNPFDYLETMSKWFLSGMVLWAAVLEPEHCFPSGQVLAWHPLAGVSVQRQAPGRDDAKLSVKLLALILTPCPLGCCPGLTCPRCAKTDPATFREAPLPVVVSCVSAEHVHFMFKCVASNHLASGRVCVCVCACRPPNLSYPLGQTSNLSRVHTVRLSEKCKVWLKLSLVALCHVPKTSVACRCCIRVDLIECPKLFQMGHFCGWFYHLV